jgi:hypothetical protein
MSTDLDLSGFTALDCEEQKSRTLDLLTEIVTEYGTDYVYQQLPYDDDHGGTYCAYVESGPEGLRPSCLVGHFFVRLGVSLDRLNFHANEPVHPDGMPTAEKVATDLNVCDDAAKILQAAQEEQDIGKTWGVALNRARARAAQGW